MRRGVVVYLKGVCMGAADLMPGVSGGTIALITGIYDRLVRALASLHPRILQPLVSVHDPRSRQEFKHTALEMDLPFLAVLGMGIASAVVIGAEVLTVAFDVVGVQLHGLFAGLIGGSAVIIGREIEWSLSRLVLALLTATIVVLVSLITPPDAAPALWLIFVSGAIAVSAMVLPGLSGALLLLILGQYEYMLAELQSFLSALRSIPVDGVNAALIDHGLIVGIFVIGAVVGLFTIAHAINRALDRNREATLTALIGLMAGGVFPPARTAAGADGLLAGISVLVAVVVGIGVVTAFHLLTGDLSYLGDRSQSLPDRE